MNRMTGTSDNVFLNIVAVIFFMICTMIFFYYLYFLLKKYMAYKTETKEDLPCPNTCDPGYECKQSEAAADFVIGDVVQEEIIEEASVIDDAEVVEETLAEEMPAAERPPIVDATI